MQSSDFEKLILKSSQMVNAYFNDSPDLGTYIKYDHSDLSKDEGILTRPELQKRISELLENRRKISTRMDMPWFQKLYLQKSFVEVLMGVLKWDDERAVSKDPELFSRTVWLVQGVQELEAEISDTNSVKYCPWNPEGVIEYHSSCAISIQRGLEKARSYRK